MRVRSRALPSVLSLLIVFAGPFGSANELADTPGMIPIGPERQSAEGLIYKGGPITSDSANNLRDLGFDLSILDPKNSDIASIPSKKQQMAPIDVRPEGEVFEYRNESKGRVGYYRVTVSKTDQNGVSRLYKIVVSKKGHNYLMRKALLRKLGYQTPDVKYLKSFKIKFDGAFSRNSFVEALNWATVDSTERWVLDGIKTEGDTVTMQDAVIMDADEQKYALPDGEMDASRIENRRILHSLVVPFNLVDNPESVNVFSWDACRITNGNVYLPFESPSVVSEYRTSFEDARWAVRRIAKLSRQELAEIVAEANLPKAVAVLMTEKVVSRRNTLMDCFKVEGEKYEFNAQISMKPDLVNGKLLTKDFAGYGPRFAFDDPTAPLTGPEMKAFFKSRVFSTAIDNAVKKFDKVSGLSTNLNKELTELQVKKAQERFEHFLKTGEIKKTPFNMFVIPTFAAKLILSRDVVTGSYLGTDHMVQQADTFGYALDAGLFMGTEGLPSPKMIVGGVAKLGTVRTYTHIKPITSIQAALKEPFKNVMVPLLKRDYATYLDELATSDEEKLAQEDLETLLKKSITEFKAQLGIGESIIISDNKSGIVGLTAGYAFDKVLQAQANLAGSLVAVKRLHIFRRDENTIQVYRTPADYNLLSAGIGVEAYIPILKLSLARKAGEAETSFYSISIKAPRDKADREASQGQEIEEETVDPKDLQDMAKNLRALHHLLLSNSTTELDKLRKPARIGHKFAEVMKNGQFFHHRRMNLNSLDGITVHHPEGGSKRFVYRSDSQISGKNFESLAIDVLSVGLEKGLKLEDVVVGEPGENMPGSGLYGSSVSRRASFEAEVEAAPALNSLKTPYVDITYQWKGWNAKTPNILEIIKEIDNRFKFNFYPPNVLNTTTKIQFYNVQLRMNVYQEGIDTLMNLPLAKLEAVLMKGNKLGYMEGGKEEVTRKERKLLERFGEAQAEYRKFRGKGKDMSMEMAKAAQYMVSMLEMALPARAFIELLGGERNIYVKSSINGFRVNDPSGDSEILSATIGEIGYFRKHAGPLRFQSSNLGMTESEFFIFWLMTKI